MASSFRILGALDTRVGLRTFVLFAICALLPILIFAAWSYRVVSNELTDAAVTRLAESSKRYGILIDERLQEAAALLDLRARRQLLLESPEREDALPEDPRFRQVNLTVIPEYGSPDRSAGDARFGMPVNASGFTSVRRVRVLPRAGVNAVELSVDVSSNGKRVLVSAEVTPGYLWNSGASEVAQAVACVDTSNGTMLSCSGADEVVSAGASSQGERALQARWRLFLKAQFGADEWVVTTSQPAAVALHSLRAFQLALPFAAGLALSAALLLSLVQIRRSHRPLRTLIAATERLGRGRFGAPIELPGRDEFTGLATAFNRLSRKLKRQLRLRTAFAAVDRAILRHPEMEHAVATMLPHVLEVLSCDVAAVLLLQPERNGCELLGLGRGEASQLVSQRVKLSENELESLVAGSHELSAIGMAPDLQHAPLFRDSHCVKWHASPVRVARRVRGVLLLGFGESRRVHRNTSRHAGELARRLAVALSNEDRDRALVKQAYFDVLSGLPNRQLFTDRLERELERATRLGTAGAVLFIDLDRFKNINDSLGHSVGDELLKVTAERLKTLTRDCDTLARLGGDEFTLICPELDPIAAGNLGARILGTLSGSTTFSGMRCVVQASIGIACFPRDGVSVEAVVRNADTAMYRAKVAGGARSVFFEEEMNCVAVRRLRVEQRLREALEEERLSLDFQAKVDASNHSLLGVEALARWHDPEDGHQSPAEFIRIAEECGLIGLLGNWVMESACRTMREWLDRGLPIPHIAINVSVQQLRDPEFADVLRRCLARHSVPPCCLELEVTESTLMHDVALIAGVLSQVRSAGVRVAIDDFGTGYSSLAVLQRLPVDILKIDRAFVQSMDDEGEGTALFKSLVGIGRALGKLVVVEGIETPGQARFAQARGCDVLQGYCFGRPEPAEEFVRNWFPHLVRDVTGDDTAIAS